MRSIRSTGDFTRKDIAILVALAVSALAAPLAAGRALATPETPAAVEAAPAIAAVAAPAPETAAACLRKVRVVYGGYGTPAGACAAR